MPNKLRGAFKFDRAEHVYTVGGAPVPSVGTIVKLAHPTTDGPWLKEEYRERGSAVHAATLAFDLGEDAASITARMPIEWAAFWHAYREFRTAMPDISWVALEEPRVHRRLRFAGIPDRVGLINGYPSILEIKTGHAAEWHAIQTAGQDILLGRQFGQNRRYVVYLTADGRFRLKPHTDTGDYLKFLSALERFHAEEGAAA